MNQLFKNLDFAAYRELEGLSISALKPLGESPLKYLHSLTAERTETPAMALGTAAHTMILEPAKSNFAVYPGSVRRGKEWDAFQAANQGATILKDDELAAVMGMASSVANYEPARQYLATGEAEVSMQWADAFTGRACRGRLDWLNPRHIITDLKTTKDASPRGFASSMVKFGYHLQAAYYCDGYHAITGVYPEFKFLVVETAAPYETALYSVPQSVIDQGREEYQRLLVLLAECEATDSWPGAVNAETPIFLPRWAQANNIQNLEPTGTCGITDGDF